MSTFPFSLLLPSFLPSSILSLSPSFHLSFSFFLSLSFSSSFFFSSSSLSFSFSLFFFLLHLFFLLLFLLPPFLFPSRLTVQIASPSVGECVKMGTDALFLLNVL
jgi:hypothetical protein